MTIPLTVGLTERVQTRKRESFETQYREMIPNADAATIIAPDLQDLLIKLCIKTKLTETIDI